MTSVKYVIYSNCLQVYRFLQVSKRNLPSKSYENEKKYSPNRYNAFSCKKTEHYSNCSVSHISDINLFFTFLMSMIFFTSRYFFLFLFLFIFYVYEVHTTTKNLPIKNFRIFYKGSYFSRKKYFRDYRKLILSKRHLEVIFQNK